MTANGMLAKEVAGCLCVSVKTVEVHRFNLMEKLEVRKAVLLAHLAIAAGLIEAKVPGWMEVDVGVQGAD